MIARLLLLERRAHEVGGVAEHQIAEHLTEIEGRTSSRLPSPGEAIDPTVADQHWETQRRRHEVRVRQAQLLEHPFTELFAQRVEVRAGVTRHAAVERKVRNGVWCVGA